MSKSILIFALGAVLASAMVFVIMKRDPAPVVESQTALQPVPADLDSDVYAEPAPVDDLPEKQSPVAAPDQPVRRQPARETPRKSARASRETKPAEVAPAPPRPPAPPVQTAENTTAQPQQPPSPTVYLPEVPAPAPPAATPKAVEETPKPEPRQPRTVTIPGGTLVTVRLDETLSTEKNQSGESFRATLDQPLIVDGLVIAERGARVEGRVIESDPGGRVKGRASMTLELVRLTSSDGQRLRLQTESFARQGESSTKKDAAKIAAGAGIGAALGAIIGGGKGAAIGAAAGGAAGTGAVIGTRGGPAQLPAETRVSFRLREPITVTEKL